RPSQPSYIYSLSLHDALPILRSTSFKIRIARNVISSKLPIGVGTRYNMPCPSSSKLFCLYIMNPSFDTMQSALTSLFVIVSLYVSLDVMLLLLRLISPRKQV